MAKQNVFERAAEAVHTGTAAECQALIAELTALEQSEAHDLKATEPPQTVWDPNGRRESQAGRRFAEAATNGTADDVARITAEHDRLSLRAYECQRIRPLLQQRATKAAEDEAREAAPRKAKALVRDLDDALDRLEAAEAGYRQARSLVEEMQRDLTRYRSLNEDCTALSLEQFTRLGHAMATRMERHITPTGDPANEGKDTTHAHMFASPEQALQAARALLPGPGTGVLSRIRQGLRAITTVTANSYGRDEPSEYEVRSKLTEWHRQRLHLLTTGSLEAAKRLNVEDAQQKQSAKVASTQ